jgi:hypothetical protein
MTAFARAMATLCNDRNLSVPAIYRAYGTTTDVPLRVVTAAAEHVNEPFSGRPRASSPILTAHLLQADIATRPLRGATLTIAGTTHAVGEARPDDEGTSWIVVLADA